MGTTMYADENETTRESEPVEETFATHMLELSEDEIYLIDQYVHNDDTDDDRRIAKPLLRRVGGAWLSLLDNSDQQVVSVSVTEREVWLLRERVPVMAMIGQKPTGLGLKKKIYRLLIQYDTERESNEAISALQVGAAMLLATAKKTKDNDGENGEGTDAPPKPRQRRVKPRKEQKE